MGGEGGGRLGDLSLTNRSDLISLPSEHSPEICTFYGPFLLFQCSISDGNSEALCGEIMDNIYLGGCFCLIREKYLPMFASKTVYSKKPAYFCHQIRHLSVPLQTHPIPAISEAQNL